MAPKCPACGLFSPSGTSVCDCGFDFNSGVAPPSPLSLAGLWYGGGVLSGFLFSLVALVVTFRLLASLPSRGGEVSGSPSVALLAILYGAIAAFVSRNCRTANWTGAIGIFAGIAVGVLGSLVGSYSRVRKT